MYTFYNNYYTYLCVFMRVYSNVGLFMLIFNKRVKL